jgi:hypothetical protein
MGIRPIGCDGVARGRAHAGSSLAPVGPRASLHGNPRSRRRVASPAPYHGNGASDIPVRAHCRALPGEPMPDRLALQELQTPQIEQQL